MIWIPHFFSSFPGWSDALGMIASLHCRGGG